MRKVVLVIFLFSLSLIIIQSCQKQTAEGDGKGIVFETCTDGIKNQDETGLDCGGLHCPKCIGKMTAIINNTDSFITTSGLPAYIASGYLKIDCYNAANNSMQFSQASGGFGLGEYPINQMLFKKGGENYSFVLAGSKINFSRFSYPDRIFDATFSVTATDATLADTVRITNGIFTDVSF
jgi:hypothetical protein